MTLSSRDAFAKASMTHIELELMKQGALGLGDFLIQASVISSHNRDSRLSADEECPLSTMRRSTSYLVLNRKLMY